MNASYMQTELPQLVLSEPHRHAVVEMCESLVSTKHDVMHELEELKDLSSEGTTAKVRNLVERVQRWLGEEIPKMDRVVRSLQAGGVTDRGAATAFVLVAESAVTVMNSYAVAADSAEKFLGAASGGAL